MNLLTVYEIDMESVKTPNSFDIDIHTSISRAIKTRQAVEKCHNKHKTKIYKSSKVGNLCEY